MKNKLVLYYSFVIPLASVLLSGGNLSASSFQECFLKAQINEIEINDDATISINVGVLSLNDTIVHTCPYDVGEQIQIDTINESNVPSSALRSGVVLQLHYRTYSGMGEDGIAVGGTTWRILDAI